MTPAGVEHMAEAEHVKLLELVKIPMTPAGVEHNTESELIAVVNE